MARDDEVYGEAGGDPQQTGRNRGNATNLDREYPIDGFAPFALDASSSRFRDAPRTPAAARLLLAAPLAAARDGRGDGARDAARSKEQREALDHLWDACLCGSLPRLREALRREGRDRSDAASLRPPWAPASAHDRTPRLGRTALHLVALGAGRALAAATRRLRRACASGAARSGRSQKATRPFGGGDDADHARCARCLLQQTGCAVDAEDAHARTPLHLAAAAGALQVLAVLLEHGADVRVADECGLTALHLACAWGRVATANALRDAGASGGAKDHKRRTPRDVTALREKCELFEDDEPAAESHDGRREVRGFVDEGKYDD